MTQKKKKICGIVLGVLVVAIAALGIVISQKPDHFHVERSAVINTTPAVAQAYVNDLGNWQSFSPWTKLDPEAKVAFEGPQAGNGALFRWDGDMNVGAGSMEITETRPGELVHFDMKFLRPFKDESVVDFTFKPDAGGTLVTWSIDGENNIISKTMSLFIDCDKMMGGFFEEGLANLKINLEKK